MKYIQNILKGCEGKEVNDLYVHVYAQHSESEKQRKDLTFTVGEIFVKREVVNIKKMSTYHFH